MPIYEYQCQECGTVSEFFTGRGDDNLLVCKGCGSSQMQKILSSTAVLSHADHRQAGRTCCGRTERCSTPPCSTGETCRKQ